MSRIALGLCLFTPLVCSGCANFIETRAITEFTDAMHDDDLIGLKAQSSDEFKQKALRLTDALDDFKILNLPDGETKIAKVEEVSDTEKRVTVEVGERKKKLLYRLVREDNSKKWVVDDIYVRQRHKGMTAAKSVTEQMDLLLSVREFLDTWDGGTREEILSVTTPELAELLKGLPPAYLAELTRAVVNEKSKAKPKAQLDEETAIVNISRSGGEVVLTFTLSEAGWKVSDLAVESREESKHIPSLAKLATAMNAAVDFLDAYAASDRKKLESVCTRTLFKKGLAHADLSALPLPVSNDLNEPYDVSLNQGGADFVIHNDAEIVRITLDRRDSDEIDQPTKYLVQDVTIFELNGDQNKKLSSVFTARSVVQIFSEALAKRNLAMLRNLSTVTFNNRVWRKLDDSTIGDMPLSEFGSGQTQIVSTYYEGPVSEINVLQGNRSITYLLHDRQGDVRIDDVLVAIPGRPHSLKETMEVLLPVVKFARAISNSDIGMLQRSSSNELNRSVWRQVDRIPALCGVALKHLQSTVAGVDSGHDKVLVTLGDDQWGARVLLVTEQDQLVVDEILLVAGPQPEQQAKLGESIREKMAEGRLHTGIMPAAHQRLQNDPHVISQTNPRADDAKLRQPKRRVTLIGQVDESPTLQTPIEPAADAFATPLDLPTTSPAAESPLEELIPKYPEAFRSRANLPPNAE